MKTKNILLILFFLTLLFRLYFSFDQENLSSDESYFHLRIIEHIKETKTPLIQDDLSYSGRTLVYPQLTHYFLALFSFIPGYEKIIPSLISSFLVIIVYLLTKKITNHELSSLFVAFMMAFLPIELKTSLNQISIYSFILPVILLMLLSLMNLENKNYFILFLVLSFILPLIHPISFLFIFSLLFYVILVNTEFLTLNNLKKEAISFSFFLILLMNFFIYKSAFLKYGTKIIWQNTPNSLIDLYFKNINVIEIIYLIGIPVIILGILGIFFGMIKQKDQDTILLTSFILSTLLLIATKLVNLSIGLFLLSIFLIIASGITIKKLYKYLELTKFHKYKTYLSLFLSLMFILFLVIPSFNTALSLNNYDEDIENFKWIKDNTEKKYIILAPLNLNHLLTYFSERKNVADTNFLLAPNVNERLNDINVAYQTWSKIEAQDVLERYNIKYIYFSDSVKNDYKIEKLLYIDKKCFKVVKDDVYKFIC